MQTLCGIAHYDYRMHRAYSYEQAFNVMRTLRLPYSQAKEMFRRMVFNVVVRNQDDHTKNISFLMNEKGKPVQPRFGRPGIYVQLAGCYVHLGHCWLGESGRRAL